MTRHAIYDSMQDHCADILTPACPFCGQKGWITIPQTAADALIEGHLVQDTLPELSARLREQIISGTHPPAAPPALSSATASTPPLSAEDHTPRPD